MANFRVDLPKEASNIIKVIGIGGGGGNAVNHMFEQGILGVDFIICNTDAQALEMSPIPNKIQIGTNISEGLGAGSKPDVGRQAAEESKMHIQDMLAHNTKMLFVTAGMGGGTGTGAAPVIAKIAKDMDILTVGIVTTPFSDEGPVRKHQAIEGIEELKPNVDALLVIANDRIIEMFGDLRISESFAKADDVLCIAAKGIAEIITVAGKMNVDFKDVKTAMTDSGRAIMGTGVAAGENRAEEAARMALESPLLNETKIEGAKHLLVNYTYGNEEPFGREIKLVNQYFQQEAGLNAQLKFGLCHDPNMGPELSVTIIATGFASNDLDIPYKAEAEEDEVQGIMLDFEEEEVATPIAKEPTNEPNPLFGMKERKWRDRGELFNQENRKEGDMYDTPAYLRKGVELDQSSLEVEVSKLSLSDEVEQSKDISLRPGNSYLHDNVD